MHKKQQLMKILSSSGPGPGQVQVRSRSGPGQVQVRSRSGPRQEAQKLTLTILYFWFPPTTITTSSFFLGFKGTMAMSNGPRMGW